ncbi:MAG: hypothetical protein Q9169_006832 [Polycauliona sp. 2 TL-2023]
MAPLNWPRPPLLHGLSVSDATSASQDYVNEVEVHMTGLGLNLTECGVLIGFMLSTLGDATRIFELVYAKPNVDADMRNEIDKFGSAMQALSKYMEAAAVSSGVQVPASEGTSIAFDDIANIRESDGSEAEDPQHRSIGLPAALTGDSHDRQVIESEEERAARIVQIDIGTEPVMSVLQGMTEEHLRLVLLQDLQDHGIRIPILFCSTSNEYRNITIFTNSQHNAAILRNPRLWRPTLFGKNAFVIPTRSPEEGTEMTVPLLLSDISKTRKAEEKASKRSRLIWIEIPDQRFATAQLLDLDDKQLRSRIQQDLQAQDIEVQIASCKKSRACRHIRLWTGNAKQADLLSKQWTPTNFGERAYVRWASKKDVASMKAFPNLRFERESTAGLDTALTASKEGSRVRREVFVRVPDQDYAERLLGSSLPQLKALARDDMESQGIPVRIASCQIIDSGSFARLRTKEPEEAQYLKTPGRWTPKAFGPNAYVVRD